MKKLTFLIITGLILANSALADESAEQNQPALAALETEQRSEWKLPGNSEKRAGRQDKQLEQSARELNRKIESELDARLDERFSRQLRSDF